MDRVATDVAKPPIPGGDLPSFEELLAKGSFHARLAQARAARERALAESGSADGFILNTSRKPWERDDDTPKADDRLVTALEATVAPSNVTRLHADAAPADLGRTGAERLPGETVAFPAAPVRRLHIVPQAAPAPAEVPSVDPVPPRRRIAMIEGGFVIGLAIGAVVAFGMLSLVDPPAGSSTAVPRALVTAGAPAMPQTTAASDGAVTLAAAVDPAPVRAVLPRLAPVQGRDAALAASAPSAALAALAGFAPTAPDVRPEPVDDPFVRPAALSAAPGAPTPLPGLSAAAAPEVAPRPLLRFAAPSMSPGDGASVLDRAAQTGSPTALDAFLPRPEVLPAAARMASLVGIPATPDLGLPAQPAPVAPGPRYPGPVVVNAPASLTDSEVEALVAGLGAEGFVVAEPARVGVTVKQSNVRYFHPEDADAAAAVAAALGALVRDFTDFSPAPPAGAIEVWLAGRETASASAQTAAPRKARQATTRPQQTELEALRDRILRQLRNGEHL